MNELEYGAMEVQKLLEEAKRLQELASRLTEIAAEIHLEANRTQQESLAD